MRLLYAPLNEPGSEQIGLTRAFQRYFDSVTVFDYRELWRQGNDAQIISKKLVGIARDLKPDIIHLQVQDSCLILPSAIRICKDLMPYLIVTHWNGDIRQMVSTYQKDICQVTDMTLISSTGQIPMYLQAGSGIVAYWQVGISPSLDIPNPNIVEQWRKNHGVGKIIFLANNYGDRFPNSKDRYKLVGSMRKTFGNEFEIYGSNWPKEFNARFVKYRQQGIVSAAAIVTLGMNHFRRLERYYSDRTAIAIASGTCHLLDHVPGIEAEYEPGKEIETFHTVEGALEKARSLIDNPVYTAEIGQAGQDRALADHTWDNRVEQYMAYLEEI